MILAVIGTRSSVDEFVAEVMAKKGSKACRLSVAHLSGAGDAIRLEYLLRVLSHRTARSPAITLITDLESQSDVDAIRGIGGHVAHMYGALARCHDAIRISSADLMVTAGKATARALDVDEALSELAIRKQKGRR